MLTDRDIEKLKAVFATKHDLQMLGDQIPSRDDVKFLESRMVSKTDIVSLENRMASKTDLKLLENRLASKEELSLLEKRIDLRLERIIQELVKFIGESYENLRKELLMHIKHNSRELLLLRKDVNVLTSYKEMTNDHEKRITHIENQLVI